MVRHVSCVLVNEQGQRFFVSGMYGGKDRIYDLLWMLWCYQSLGAVVGILWAGKRAVVLGCYVGDR